MAHTPCLPYCFNSSSPSYNPPLIDPVSDWRNRINWSLEGRDHFWLNDFKAGLIRRGLELWDINITVDEDHDWNLAIPPLTGEVLKEWAVGWWLKKTETIKHLVCPFISNSMIRFDDDNEDIYSEVWLYLMGIIGVYTVSHDLILWHLHSIPLYLIHPSFIQYRPQLFFVQY